MTRVPTHALPAALLFVLILQHADVADAAEVTLAPLFVDHAVLQRDRIIPVWGTATAGTAVAVTFADQDRTAIADAAGEWRTQLDPQPVSATARDLVVRAGAAVLTRHDVLVGDVWLCSGQSNMTMAVGACADAPAEIAAAAHPQLRMFTVAQRPALAPARDAAGAWVVCAPGTVAEFSGVAYFFGRTLQQELQVPIGLIHASVGGTPAESWTAQEALMTVPVLAERARADHATFKAQPEALRRFPGERRAWEEAHGVIPPPIAAAARGWADADLDTHDWNSVTLPGTWQQLGFTSGGVFWLRKEIHLPTVAAGHAFVLKLNWMNEQYDTAFWNGVEIGHGGDQAPDYYFGQRSYLVPAGLVTAGRNVVAVRICSASVTSGVWQWGSQLEVPVPDPATIDDRWLARQETAFPPLAQAALAGRPKLVTMPFRMVQSALYNGMIAPLIPYALRGAIWYQGENNAGRPGEYRQLLTLMIQDWRSRWGQGDFPFLIQQLVNNGMPPKTADQRADWAFLREAQLQVADTVPHAGIAVGPDLGSRYTIHPTTKQEVGRRLALVALAQAHGRTSEASGPRYQAMEVTAGAISLTFTHAHGLAAMGGPLQRFAIAGVDRQFVWAEAVIAGEAVTVSSPQVAQPVAVRYAWAENAEGCNLVNAAGLPAPPFRTDRW
ncbi:MAG: hypothetical protein H0X38_02555 [Planctomycetes bacterium]|nr:hypothetical protein [Planctomycetota bacterium]